MVEGQGQPMGPECPYTSDCWIMPWVWHDGGTQQDRRGQLQGEVQGDRAQAAEDRTHSGPTSCGGAPGSGVPPALPVVEAHSVYRPAGCAGLSVHMVVVTVAMSRRNSHADTEAWAGCWCGAQALRGHRRGIWGKTQMAGVGWDASLRWKLERSVQGFDSGCAAFAFLTGDVGFVYRAGHCETRSFCSVAAPSSPCFSSCI